MPSHKESSSGFPGLLARCWLELHARQDAYGERALAGLLPTVTDPDHAAAALYDRLAAVGSLQRYLDGPEIEHSWINEPGRVTC